MSRLMSMIRTDGDPFRWYSACAFLRGHSSGCADVYHLITQSFSPCEADCSSARMITFSWSTCRVGTQHLLMLAIERALSVLQASRRGRIELMPCRPIEKRRKVTGYARMLVESSSHSELTFVCGCVVSSQDFDMPLGTEMSVLYDPCLRWTSLCPRYVGISPTSLRGSGLERTSLS